MGGGRVFVVGGLDPSARAGILADVRAAAMAGASAMAAAAVLTAQGDGLRASTMLVDPAFLREQLERAASCAEPGAIKTGALGSAAQVGAVAAFVEARPGVALVVDPVVAATSGGRLLDDAGVLALRAALLPLATLVTPNLAEAAILSHLPCGDRESMVPAARAILDGGPAWVLVKGGHLAGDPADLLAGPAGETIWLEGRRIRVETHGTGCMLASAIAAGLAGGLGVEESVLAARSLLAVELARG
jgi:hydroxymethylpyrimidine/phosphomethylpyrimidine kinase